MPIKFLIICVILCFNLSVMAQQDIHNDLLNLAKYKQNQNNTYTGGAFVHIDLPETQKQPEVFKPTPLHLSGTYPITTPFGQQTEAAFVPHATDFNTIIQILSDGSVIMEQTIQFVNTKKADRFVRSFKKQNQTQMMLLKSLRGNTPINSVKISETQTHWRITDDTELPSGIYSYTISYLLKNALQLKEDKAYISLSLTGDNFSLPVERFSAVMLLPKKAAVTHTLTFGSNNVTVPEAFKTQTDDKGNVTYHLTRPLPAYAEVKINATFDKNALSFPTFWDNLLNTVHHLLFVVCLAAFALYALLTRLYLKYHHSDKFPLKELKYYSPLALRYMTNHTLSVSFIQDLKAYNGVSKRPFRIPTFFEKSPLSSYSKAFIFLNVMRKYILTMLLMVGLTLFQAINTGFPLNIIQIVILIGIVILLNVWLFKTAEKPYIKKKMSVLMKNLLQINIAPGASKASLKALFLRFYPYTLVMDKQNEWCRLMQEYHPDIDINMFDKEGK